MLVRYNQPNFAALKSAGGAISVYNDLQTIVNHPEEGLSSQLKAAVAETSGGALVWVHHGFVRDGIRVFKNKIRSTPVEKQGRRGVITLAQYEDHLGKVERFALNWHGVVFDLVALGPSHIKQKRHDKIQRHLKFLEERASLRTQKDPLSVVIVPTFFGSSLPYLSTQRGDEKFLESGPKLGRYYEREGYDEYEGRIWMSARNYLHSLGCQERSIYYIGERYSKNHVTSFPYAGLGDVQQEYQRCVRQAYAYFIGGTILDEYCFPGEFGSLIDLSCLI